MDDTCPIHGVESAKFAGAGVHRATQRPKRGAAREYRSSSGTDRAAATRSATRDRSRLWLHSCCLTLCHRGVYTGDLLVWRLRSRVRGDHLGSSWGRHSWRFIADRAMDRTGPTSSKAEEEAAPELTAHRRWKRWRHCGRIDRHKGCSCCEVSALPVDAPRTGGHIQPLGPGMAQSCVNMTACSSKQQLQKAARRVVRHPVKSPRTDLAAGGPMATRAIVFSLRTSRISHSVRRCSAATSVWLSPRLLLRGVAFNRRFPAGGAIGVT